VFVTTKWHVVLDGTQLLKTKFWKLLYICDITTVTVTLSTVTNIQHKLYIQIANCLPNLWKVGYISGLNFHSSPLRLLWAGNGIYCCDLLFQQERITILKITTVFLVQITLTICCRNITVRFTYRLM
jgi:hypothetical protein